MPSTPRSYYVYIMTNRSKTLYTGVTGNLIGRTLEHKQGIKGEFAARYKIDRLVYYERFGRIGAAIAREKQIKGLLRMKKIALIVSMNPVWKDLSEGWYVQPVSAPYPDVILRQRRPSQSEDLPTKDLCIWLVRVHAAIAMKRSSAHSPRSL
ncbi:MAG: GIY-YIG nuclease family protein [Terriglobales bacterium]